MWWRYPASAGHACGGRRGQSNAAGGSTTPGGEGRQCGTERGEARRAPGGEPALRSHGVDAAPRVGSRARAPRRATPDAATRWPAVWPSAAAPPQPGERAATGEALVAACRPPAAARPPEAAVAYAA
eukprot:1840903-Pleurochrysis_carterae.AAC.1